jgi:hypothetical protein
MKKCFRIGIIFVTSLVAMRCYFVVFEVTNPDVYVYNSIGEVINLEKEVVDELVSSARAAKSEWKTNPLMFSDYIKIVFWGNDEFDPMISIFTSIDSNAKSRYEVTFSGFRFGHYVTYIINEDLKVTSIGFDSKS